MMDSTSLPAVSQGMTFNAVAHLGTVRPKTLPNGLVRFWIDFGRREGKRIRLYSVPSAADKRPIALANQEMAQQVLDAIRAEIRNGRTLDQVLASYQGRSAPVDLFENQMAGYLAHWEASVASEKRSPGSIRELRRYTTPGGHFDYWRGKSVRSISYADIEDYHLWLANRVSPKTGERLSAKTQRNVSDAFRTFLRWLERRGVIDKVPAFPRIEVTGYEPRILTLEQQAAVLEAIPWDRRGAFLAGAFEALRLSEIRALDLDDYEDGWLDVSKAVKGNAVTSPIRGTKNRTSQRREIWNPELKQWIEWRLKQASAKARLRGETALFWNPTARNTPKRWAPDPLEKEWNRACEKVGIRGVPFQQGTRHTTLTALAQGGMQERMLRQFSRHRSAGSLDHYSKPRATPEVIVRAWRPGRSPAG